MNEPVVLPASDRWTVPNTGGGAGVRVTLSLPLGQGPGPVHMLVLLDGDTMFLTATEFARTVRLVSLGTLAPIAVVGIMRDEPDSLRYMSSRFRDYTPQQWTLPGPFEPDNAFAVFGTGGAAAMLGTIEDHVLPGVRERCSAVGLEMGDVCIGGWSLSGLFASWAWLERPQVFQHLLAISPSLWWHDASILDEVYASRPAGHRAFVCAGEHEEGDLGKVWPPMFANGPQRELAAMVRNAKRFADRLAELSVDVEHVTFSDEHHITLQAAAIGRGIRHVFR